MPAPIADYLTQAELPFEEHAPGQYAVPLRLQPPGQTDPVTLNTEVFAFADGFGDHWLRLAVNPYVTNAPPALVSRLAYLNERAAGVRFAVSPEGHCQLLLDLLMSAVDGPAIAAALRRLALYAAGFWQEVEEIVSSEDMHGQRE